jgi:hypothetical protein
MAEDKLLSKPAPLIIEMSDTDLLRPAVIQGPIDDRKEHLVEYLDCFELEAAEGTYQVSIVLETRR